MTDRRLAQHMPELRAFMLQEKQRRYTAQCEMDYLQVRKSTKLEGIGALVIVLVEIVSTGQGQFTELMLLLREAGIRVIVELPQPRLESYCRRNNIEVIVDDGFIF